MALYPLFADLAGREVLVVGAGVSVSVTVWGREEENR